MQRADDAFRAKYGRGMIVDANGVSADPEYNAFTSQAMATDYKTQADALERSKRNMNRVRNAAYVAAAVPFVAAAAPAIAGIGAGSATGGGTAAASSSVLPSTSLIPGALATPGGASMISPTTAYVASEGIKTAGNLYGSKKGSDAATKSADMQTRAATEAARIQAQSSADQLAYLKRQSELDRLSKRFTDKQNYGLSSAGVMNDFSRYGDTSFNTRASELSQGRTQDKMYGARQNQMNYMRNLLGMPQNELSVYVEPDALQLTRPTLPDYVEDTTPIE